MFKKIAFLMVFCATVCANNLSWELPQVLSSSDNQASNGRIGIDANGNFVAAWIENDVVMASQRSLTGSWTPATSVSTSGASSLELVVDQAGNATAIWSEAGVIQSASMPFLGTWGTPVAVSTSGTASSPQIAVDSTGNLAAVWQSNGVIQASTKAINKKWKHPSNLSSSTLTSDSAQIAIGDNETIVAVWHAIKSGVDSIYSASTTLGGSWSSSSIISNKGVASTGPNVAVDPNGNALAAWYTFDLSGTDYSNVYVQAAFAPSDGTWGTATNISGAGMRNPDELMVNVAFDQTGLAVAMWTNGYDASTFNLEASVYSTTGWIPTVQIADFNVYLYSQNFMISPFNYAYATFMAYASSITSPVIQTFKANTANNVPNFGDIQTISQGGSNIYPYIAGTLVDDAHAAGAVWLNYNGTNTVVQASVGRGVALSTPSNLMLTQSSNNLGEITEYYNMLTWASNAPDSTSNWVIFRNGLWLQTLPIMQLKFIDNNVVQNQAVTYGVALQSVDGDMSSISTISFP